MYKEYASVPYFRYQHRKEHTMMRYLLKAVVCALVISCLMSMTGFYGACDDIREEVLRLHILANSDSEEDQALKLRVRDALLVKADELFRGCECKADSIEQAKKHMDELKRTAQQVIREEGHDEPVEVCLTRMPFQTRVYENFSLPAGEYDALRVVIGKGEGHNWWCVLFPALCLPSGGSRELEGVMSAGEEEIVCESDRFDVRFMLVEWWEGICSWFR